MKNVLLYIHSELSRYPIACGERRGGASVLESIALENSYSDSILNS